jgi:hypothetical protein
VARTIADLNGDRELGEGPVDSAASYVIGGMLRDG